MMSLDRQKYNDVQSSVSSKQNNPNFNSKERNWLNRINVFSALGSYKYACEDDQAVIVMDAVRNLVWRINGGEPQSVSCAAGTIFYIPAGTQVTIDWPVQVERLSVNFASTLSSERNTETVQSAQRLFCKESLMIAKIIKEQIQNNAETDENYLQALVTVIGNLISKHVNNARNDQQATGLSNYAAHQIENYLKQHFQEPISVPDMAALLGISTGHFATSFRQTFGQSPHQYLLSLKLDEAERSLIETNTPIQAIAATLGFSSQSHLTTALRKYRKLTPGELRRRRNMRNFMGVN